MKSNSYLINKTDGTSSEILADHYEREGDEWVFMIGSREVLRPHRRDRQHHQGTPEHLMD